MKLIQIAVILASILNLNQALKCDTSSFDIKFYDDSNCTVENVALTEKGMKSPARIQMLKDCIAYDSLSSNWQCTPSAMLLIDYSDKVCGTVKNTEQWDFNVCL